MAKNNDPLSGSEIESFIAPLNTPGTCLGSLFAQSMTDLDRLSQCTRITGHLSIGGWDWNAGWDQTTNITSLKALRYLVSVGKSLSIAHNNHLTNLSGLENLTNIGQALWIQHNASLTSLDGLYHLNNLGTRLIIENNKALTGEETSLFKQQLYINHMTD